MRGLQKPVHDYCLRRAQTNVGGAVRLLGLNQALTNAREPIIRPLIDAGWSSPPSGGEAEAVDDKKLPGFY